MEAKYRQPMPRYGRFRQHVEQVIKVVPGPDGNKEAGEWKQKISRQLRKKSLKAEASKPAVGFSVQVLPSAGFAMDPLAMELLSDITYYDDPIEDYPFYVEKPLLEWELSDARGFAMRRGHGARWPWVCSPGPGRTSFKRRAGGHRDVLRCSMCKPGRHQGAGGAKSLKKVKNSQVRMRWLQLLEEVRFAEHCPNAAEVGPLLQLPRRKKPCALPVDDEAPSVESPEAPARVKVSDFLCHAHVPQPPVPSIQWCRCRGCPQSKRVWRRLTTKHDSTSQTSSEDYQNVYVFLDEGCDEWQVQEEEEDVWVVL